LVKPLKRYFHSGEINFEVSDKEKKIQEIAQKYQDQPNARVSYLDGLKIEFPNWWLSLRPSNTEPLLRLNLEAKTKELMEEKKQELKALIQG
jgi:phosphomannomutase